MHGNETAQLWGRNWERGGVLSFTQEAHLQAPHKRPSCSHDWSVPRKACRPFHPTWFFLLLLLACRLTPQHEFHRLGVMSAFSILHLAFGKSLPSLICITRSKAVPMYSPAIEAGGKGGCESISNEKASKRSFWGFARVIGGPTAPCRVFKISP